MRKIWSILERNPASSAVSFNLYTNPAFPLRNPRSFESTIGNRPFGTLNTMESAQTLWLPFVGNYRTFLMERGDFQDLDVVSWTLK
jgi:hypothetical protein